MAASLGISSDRILRCRRNSRRCDRAVAVRNILRGHRTCTSTREHHRDGTIPYVNGIRPAVRESSPGVERCSDHVGYLIGRSLGRVLCCTLV